MAYRVKRGPCLLRPNSKSGTFSTSRKKVRLNSGGVSCPRSMDVPDMPLS